MTAFLFLHCLNWISPTSTDAVQNAYKAAMAVTPDRVNIDFILD